MSATKRSGIGGSDIAAIAGCHPYKTAADVYARIVADVAPAADSPRMALGRAMESHIIDAYAMANGLDPAGFARTVEIQAPGQPWRRGELDALDRARKLALDAKLVVSPRQFARWGEAGSDQVPDEYLLQAHWYQALADTELFVIVAFIEGDLREYEIPRDREIEGTLIEIASRFWRDNVEKRVPPPLTGCDPATLRALFPRNAAPLRDATDLEHDLISRYAQAREVNASGEQVEEELKAALQAAIGDAEGIQCPLGKITWKNNKDGQATDWQAVARALKAPQELVEQHTTAKPGARVFRFHPAKETQNGRD